MKLRVTNEMTIPAAKAGPTDVLIMRLEGTGDEVVFTLAQQTKEGERQVVVLDSSQMHHVRRFFAGLIP